MTQKPQRRSKAVLAREAAREKAARFRELEDERLRIAESAILIQEEIDDFDEETERRVAKLREERNSQLGEKRQKLDALVVEMLDTEIPAQEASERLGMSVGQVRAAKRSFEQTVAALAEGSADSATATTDDAAAPSAPPAEEADAAALRRRRPRLPSRTTFRLPVDRLRCRLRRVHRRTSRTRPFRQGRRADTNA